MRSLEIISQMSDVVNLLSDIVKRQQTEIERAKVEAPIKEELRTMVQEADDKKDVLEYHLRKVIDRDDGEPFEKGVADDD
jgi:hypothetical protein